MKLLDIEYKGPLTDKTWMHTGDHGQDVYTVETTQDVEPVLAAVKDLAQAPKHKDFQYLGSIPVNLINEISKQLAATWGVQVREAYAELVGGKTDRSKKVWKMLLESRDYRKLQAKAHQ